MSKTNQIYKVAEWLRYSIFIFLYPLGITGEARCYYGGIQWMTENEDSIVVNKWQYLMPNGLNFEITLRAYLIGAIVCIFGFGSQLYQHMMKQRRKALNPKPKTKTK